VNDVTPEVGMGATYGIGSDRYAATVVAVSNNGREIEVQEDQATPTDKHEFFGQQDYTYTRNPEAPRMKFSLRRNGRWIRSGESMRGGMSLGLGHRSQRIDPSF